MNSEPANLEMITLYVKKKKLNQPFKPGIREKKSYLVAKSKM